MTSTQITCFIASAETKSFTTAANRLYMSQSALSRSIASLETELGFTLFTRNNNSIELTDGGKKLYKWACNANIQLKEIVNTSRNGQSSGSLVIGYIKNEQLLEQFQSRIVKLREIHPEIELRFVLHDSAKDIINSLKNGSIDVAFMIDSALQYVEGLSNYNIGKSKYVVVVSMLHHLCDIDSISFKGLEKETFIAINYNDSPAMVEGLHNIAEQFGFRAKIKEKKNINEVIDSVINGDGVVLLYEDHAAIYNKMLHVIRIKENLNVNICFAINPRNDNPSITLLKAVFI